MSLNLAEPLRAALIGSVAVTAHLAEYKSNFPVFTRRPIPDDAVLPVIIVSPDIDITQQDLIDTLVPIIQRDVSVYGRNNDPANYRAVETIAYAVRTLFHRQRTVITVSGWNVIDILVRGPRPAPTDDEQTVGRMLSLTIRMSPS